MSIALLAGTQRAVQTALDFIIEILTSQFNQFGTIELRLVVPNSSISPIMGKAGTKITSIREGTGAKLQISGRDAGRGNADVERIVHISGHPDQVRNAARIVSSIMQADSLLKDYMVFNVAAGGDRAALASPYGMDAAATAFANTYMPTAYSSSVVPASAAGEHVTHDYTLIGLAKEDKDDANTWIKTDLVRPEVMQVETTVHIQIPDELVGSLMGRNGQSLTEIRSNSAAKINISQRGELVPGTRDRLITIRGNMKAVHTAHGLIIQRLAETQDGARNPE